jgi:DNA-binding Lrp family transcriptional regulator
MAAEAGIETEQLLGVLRGWAEEKKLRRIGAIVNHFKVGMGAGAMVAWLVEEQRVEQVGTVLAGFPEVSHAYERHTEKNWPYNVYTMVHGESDEQVRDVVRRMSEAAQASDYRVLNTEKELKKVAPTYVFEDDQ